MNDVRLPKEKPIEAWTKGNWQGEAKKPQKNPRRRYTPHVNGLPISRAALLQDRAASPSAQRVADGVALASLALPAGGSHQQMPRDRGSVASLLPNGVSAFLVGGCCLCGGGH